MIDKALSKEMENKSYWDLKDIMEEPDKFTNDEVDAARFELEMRNHFEYI